MSYSFDTVPPLLPGPRPADVPDISDVILAEMAERLRTVGEVIVTCPPVADGVAACIAGRLANELGVPVRVRPVDGGLCFEREGRG